MSPAPTLVLLAAGLGTRYGGLKQIDPVGPGDTAILDYTLADAARAGFGRAILVVRRDIEGEVRRHLARTGGADLAVTLVHQTLGSGARAGRTRPWGTTHAVLSAAPEIDGPFAVANADDHYGADAWACLAEWLAGARPPGPPGVEADPARSAQAPVPRGAAVGYRLADTLSRHGGVSRAVLEADAEGRLVGVREVTDVRGGPDGAITGEVDGERRPLDGDARISMNLWGFERGVLHLLTRVFEGFLARSPGPEEELHLPDVIGDAVTARRVRVRLLPCGTDWFGMTHPDDRPTVVRRLEERGPPRLPPSALPSTP